MQQAGCGPVAHHTVRYHDHPALRGAWHRLRAAGEALDGGCDAWGDLDLQDGIFLSIPRGAVATVVAKLREARTGFGHQSGVAAGLVVVRQLRPELVDGLINRWLRDAGQLLAVCGRLLIETARMVRPQGGSDRYWIVRTRGQAEAEVIGAAAGAMLRAAVQAQEVLAYNPATRGDEQGVMICVPADCARALRDMPAEARRIYAGGDRFEMDPVTTIGQRGRGLRKPRTAAAEQHRAFWQGRGARGGEAAIVVATTPADATGQPGDGEETARVLPTAAGGEATGPPAATDALAVAEAGKHRAWHALPMTQHLELDIPLAGRFLPSSKAEGVIEIAGAGEIGRIAAPGTTYAGLCEGRSSTAPRTSGSRWGDWVARAGFLAGRPPWLPRRRHPPWRPARRLLGDPTRGARIPW